MASNPNPQKSSSRQITSARREYLRKYQRSWFAKRRQEWINQNGPCAICGSCDRLEVDHVNPAEKKLNPRSLWGMSSRNPRRVAELAKCQVLCRECHKEKTRPLQRLNGMAQDHSNRTGYRGVTLERCGRYRARVYASYGKRVTIGWFDDPSVAGEAVRQFLISQGAEYAAGRAQ